MRVTAILGEVLPVLGTVGLLGLWLFQQTGIERRSSEVQRLTAARSVFQTYQSNNALFNAIETRSEKDAAADGKLRANQLYSYERGLAAIEDALPQADRADVPPPTDPFGGDAAANMEQVQKRIDILQGKLDSREATVRESAVSAKETYFILYIVISLAALVGAICKVADKFF